MKRSYPYIWGTTDTTMLKPIKPSQLLEAITALFAQSPSQSPLSQSPPPQLPLTPVQTQPSTPSDNPLPHELGTQTPLSILVAKDNQVNQLVIGMLLEHLGYQADYAANGKEVLAALERQPYDVVFMDVQMPIMDGISATRELCGRYAVNSRPRIVGMMGNALPEVRLECERAGMNELCLLSQSRGKR
jgi:CheY-like chemotaxis protein